jgi:acyl-CoA thioester hydrolase
MARRGRSGWRLSSPRTSRSSTAKFFREDGGLAARVSTLGGWLDLSKRKLTVPPEALAEALRLLQRAEDFQELQSSLG